MTESRRRETLVFARGVHATDTHSARQWYSRVHAACVFIFNDLALWNVAARDMNDQRNISNVKTRAMFALQQTLSIPVTGLNGMTQQIRVRCSANFYYMHVWRGALQVKTFFFVHRVICLSLCINSSLEYLTRMLRAIVEHRHESDECHHQTLENGSLHCSVAIQLCWNCVRRVFWLWK